MKLTGIATFAYTISVALLWKPVHAESKPTPGPVCPSTGLRMSVLYLPPFTNNTGSKIYRGILGDFFQHIVKKCFVQKCQLSLNSYTVKLFNSTESFREDIAANNTDIAFPITRPTKMFLSGETYTGPALMFDTLIKSPGYSLIMNVESVNSKANDIVFATLLESTWPIFVFTLLIAGISGICVWVLETYFNEEEFPRSFTKGSYEGFWWAFVSMTTVGYGDKTPKFVLGRIFGVFWILLGLIVIAIFTATATSALSIDASALARVEGQKIGVLEHTSANLEANKKGADKVVEFSTTEGMLDALRKDKIDGILMDQYMASYVLHEHHDSNDLKVFTNYEAEIHYDLAYPHNSNFMELFGARSCVKKKLDKNDVDDLLITYLMPVAVYNAESDSTSIFSGKNVATGRTLLVITGIFLGLVFIGLVAEVVFRLVKKGKRKVKNSEDGVELKEVKVHTSRAHLKDIEDKVGQLVKDVGKLQEQLTAMSSSVNGTLGGLNTTHM